MLFRKVANLKQEKAIYQRFTLTSPNWTVLLTVFQDARYACMSAATEKFLTRDKGSKNERSLRGGGSERSYGPTVTNALLAATLMRRVSGHSLLNFDL